MPAMLLFKNSTNPALILIVALPAVAPLKNKTSGGPLSGRLADEVNRSATAVDDDTLARES
jgi:hypothetical protein